MYATIPDWVIQLKLPTCSNNSANAPWGWDDSNDGSVYKGEMALDPAHLTDVYFDGLGTDK